MDSGKISRREAESRRSALLMKRLLLGFKGLLDEELRPQGVSTAQLRFLNELRERPGASGAQMARACYMTPQSAQAMMMRAVERGWVVRGKSPESERLVTARLTRAGEKLLAHADAIMARLEAEVWKGVTVSELRAMNEVIERGLANLAD